jgi:hypothetical protein
MRKLTGAAFVSIDGVSRHLEGRPKIRPAASTKAAGCSALMMM